MSALLRQPRHSRLEVQHGRVRAAWDVASGTGRVPHGLDFQPASSMLLVSMQSGPTVGRVLGGEHGGDDFGAAMFVMEGGQRIRHQRADLLLHPGDVLLWTSRMSCDFEVPVAQRKLQILAPMDYFARMWPSLVADASPVHIPAGGAMATLACTCAHTLWSQRMALAQRELPQALESVLDLLARSFRPAAPASRSKGQLFNQIIQYIGRELEDPALGPVAIARRHGCSVRTLHALFAERQLTVAGYIRHCRLEQCRRALGECTMGRIGDLALRWGFNDAAHFSKLFRTAYGVTPRHYRDSKASGALLIASRGDASTSGTHLFDSSSL